MGRSPECLGIPLSLTCSRLASHRLPFCPLAGTPSSHPHGKGHPATPACSTELPPRLGYGGHTHTRGSWRSTYSPFLLARRARLRQTFVLLFHLREQTKKSLAGEAGGLRLEGTEGKHPTGLAPWRAGLLRAQEYWGYRPGQQIYWGQNCPVTTSRMKSLCGVESQVPLPSVTSQSHEPRELKRSTHESRSWPWLQGG